MFYLSKDLYVVLRDCDAEYVVDKDLEIYNDYDEACAEAERLTFLETEEWEKKNPEAAGGDWRPSYLTFGVLSLPDAIERRLSQVEESAYDSGSNSGYENGYDEGFSEGESSKDQAYDDGYQQGLQDGKQQSDTE